jgi:hypothetical protein
MPTLKSDATTLVLTNRHKVFWPKEGYTKGEFAPVIRHYRKDRPQSKCHEAEWQSRQAIAAPPPYGQHQPCASGRLSLR